jgi:tripartite-type tricarboxylate transporter receptor subunit TctC
LAKVLAMPDVRERLTALGLTVGFMPQGQFAGRVRSYTQTWAQIIKESGFTPQ